MPNDTTEKVIIKARYWWFVVYPESAPADWRDRIQATGLPFCVSPLHDKDINPDGTPKKPHYHVILCYNGPTTYSNVKKTMTDPLGQPHPQYLNSVKGAYRYLTHQDNPEKYQYDKNGVQHFGGFSTADYCDMSITDEDRLYSALEDYIQDKQLVEFLAVVYSLKNDGLFEMLSFFRRHTVYFKEFIKSARHGGFELMKPKNDIPEGYEVDHTTGELVKVELNDETPLSE